MTRNGSVEFVRFVAAIGIVWFHESMQLGGLALAGLSAFFVLLVYFSILKNEHKKSISQVALANIHFLNIWIIWSIIYVILKIAQAIVQGRSISDEFEWWMLLTGPALHLWFLPFAYFVVIVNFAFTRKLAMVPNGIRVVVELALLSIVSYLVLRLSEGFSIPWIQYVNILPPIIFSLCLVRYPANSWEFLMVVALGIVILFWLPPNIYLPWVIGCTVAAASLIIHTNASPVVLLLGRLSLTIYLVHPAISSVFKFVLPIELDAVSTSVAITVVSISVAFVLDRFEYKKYLGLR